MARPASSQSFKHNGAVIRVDELYRNLDRYVGNAHRANANVSPSLAGNLRGRALLVTNDINPLRGEAGAYGGRLREAGVAVEAIHLEGIVHGCM